MFLSFKSFSFLLFKNVPKWKLAIFAPLWLTLGGKQTVISHFGSIKLKIRHFWFRKLWVLSGTFFRDGKSTASFLANLRPRYFICQCLHRCFSPRSIYPSRSRLWFCCGGLYCFGQLIQVSLFWVRKQVRSSYRKEYFSWLRSRRKMGFVALFFGQFGFYVHGYRCRYLRDSWYVK